MHAVTGVYPGCKYKQFNKICFDIIKPATETIEFAIKGPYSVWIKYNVWNKSISEQA